MTGRGAEWALIGLGVASAALLVAYGVVAVNGFAGTDLAFWAFVGLFLVYIGWDTQRHLRSLRSRATRVEDRGR